MILSGGWSRSHGIPRSSCPRPSRGIVACSPRSPMRVAPASAHHPLPFHPHLPHQLLRRMVVRKQERVADVVERLTENRESLCSRGEQRREPVLRSEPVVGGEREPAAPHLLV